MLSSPPPPLISFFLPFNFFGGYLPFTYLLYIKASIYLFLFPFLDAIPFEEIVVFVYLPPWRAYELLRDFGDHISSFHPVLPPPPPPPPPPPLHLQRHHHLPLLRPRPLHHPRHHSDHHLHHYHQYRSHFQSHLGHPSLQKYLAHPQSLEPMALF
ncbi:hypothetical protein OIU79_001504 [Salix purpurea]|uniref:Uncharacterized protein n=1 Tax=Salix purpurea TaxID=77065 RepID=A0A9Q0UQW8_SALPP|nr:hypothetical protein OIU79_001504 [Salix purpurea]